MTTTELPLPEVLLPDVPLPNRIDSRRLELPCQNGDADLWFAEEPAGLEQAKALCRGCPLQEPCLAEALGRGEPWGVWGGEIFDRGAVIARKRPRGRPRKNAAG